MPHYDAVIVGLGAAGCWAAKELAERGLRVAALEAGDLLEDRDLPRRVPRAGYARRMLQFRRYVQARSISFHPRVSHLYVDDLRHPYSTRGGDPFLWIRGRQVGGRLHTWARMALRLGPRDFTRAREDDHGAPWPIRYPDLAPYYDRVEEFYGLRGGRDGLEDLPDGRVSREVELSPAAVRFAERVRARRPGRRVIAPRVLETSIGPLPEPLRAALEHGRVDLKPGSAVARVLTDRGGGRAVGVEVVNARTRERSIYAADLVVLCASAIETVRILFNSRCAAHPRGLGNTHDQLGRHVMDHNLVVATGRTPAEYRDLLSAAQRAREHAPLDLGAELDFYLPDVAATLEERDFVRGFGVQGRLSADTWGMAAFGEMLPHADNRVTPARGRDALGIPTVNIRVRRGPNERAMIAAQKRELRALAADAGLPLAMPLPALLRGLLWRAVGPEVGVMHLGVAIHEAGGARMGDDPTASVTDARNRLWDVPNVLVTDASCFPSTGYQNPTLTIMAVTARACALAAGGAAPPVQASGGEPSTRSNTSSTLST